MGRWPSLIGRIFTLGNSTIAVTMSTRFSAPALAFVPNLRPTFRYLSQLCTCGLKTHPVTISMPYRPPWDGLHRAGGTFLHD